MGVESDAEGYLRPYVDSGNFSGAVLLAEGGTVLHCAGYGMANYEHGVSCRPSTRFHIASVSKPFTALAVLILERQGRLRRNDVVERYVSALPGSDRISLTHLLTHTSGIPDINGAPCYSDLARSPQTPSSLVERITAWMRETGQSADPGANRYSNSNYNLLAAIIEKVADRAYGEFLQESIFGPAGMLDTTHDGNAADLIPERAAGYSPSGLSGVRNSPYLDWSVKTGNGSLVSTVQDLHRFHCALSSDAIVPSRLIDDALKEGGGNRYGWFVRTGSRGRSLAANGRSPGFTASFERFRAHDRCVVVLSNRYSSVSQWPIAEDLARIVFGEPVHGFDLEVPRDLAGKLARFGGIYRAGDDFPTPNVVFRVHSAEDHLSLEWASATLPLVPLGSLTFRDRLFWGEVRFELDPSGAARSLIWTYGDRNYRAERIRDAPD